MYSPKVSIVILNWNSKEDTLACIDSILKIDYSNFDIVLVDNASCDDSCETFKKKFGDNPIIHMIFNKNNAGFSGGNNIGIAYAVEKKTDYILILNNDTVTASHFLTLLVETAQKNKNIAMVSPKILFYKHPKKIYFAGGKLIRCLGRASHIGLGKIDTGQYDQACESAFLTGCCLLIKQEIIKKLGKFDEEFNDGYLEDIDLCERVKKHHYKLIYEPKSVIWHKCFGSIGHQSENYYYQIVKNNILFVRKHTNMISTILIFMPYFIIWRIIGSGLKCLFMGKMGHIKAIYKAIAWNINYKK